MAIAAMNGQSFGGRAIKVNRPTTQSGGGGGGGGGGGSSLGGIAALSGLMPSPLTGLLPNAIPGLFPVGTAGTTAATTLLAAAQAQAQAQQRLAAAAAASSVPPPLPTTDGSVSHAQLAAAVAKAQGSALLAIGGKHHRIYVGSIYFELNAEQVKAVFAAFGKVISCELIMDSANPGKHKGYGFVEFEEEKAAQAAIAQMNNFDLCGRSLKVRRLCLSVCLSRRFGCLVVGRSVCVVCRSVWSDGGCVVRLVCGLFGR